MRSGILLTLAFCSAAAFGTDTNKWQLVWSDEFNENGLISEQNWNYESGFIRNGEQQYYTVRRPENVVQRDGKLIITARKEQVPNAAYKPGSTDRRYKNEKAEYTAGSITTFGKKDFLYGRIEVCAKLPKGAGFWPAIWMLGTTFYPNENWPFCGELDIMENFPSQTHRIYASIHWSDKAKLAQVHRGHAMVNASTASTGAFDQFNVYAMEWDQKELRFYYNDTLYITYDVNRAGQDPDNAFRKPFFLLLNFAIDGGWEGKLKDSDFPAEYQIDYVRYYKQIN